MDHQEIDTYSLTNEALALKSQEKNGRNIIKINSLEDAGKLNNKVTNYSQYLRRDYKYRFRKLLWKAKKVFAHMIS